MPKYHAPTPGRPIGHMLADPMLARSKKEGPARGYSRKETDRRIRELVQRERDKQA